MSSEQSLDSAQTLTHQKRLAGKICLITGASRGIGQAVAEQCAAEGAHVIINTATSVDQAEAVCAGLVCDDGQAHRVIQADVADEAAIQKMMQQIKARFGRLDVLVNNAGTTRFVAHANLDGLDTALFDQIYAVNLRGPYLCVRHGLALLRKSESALVVNMASIAAQTAVGSNIAYCATKAALVNMTKSLARALAPTIRVNAISPGLIDTELTQTFGAYRQEQIAKTPMGRLGYASDVAKAVVALAVDLPYVTGTDLVLDGGRSLN